ncbi:MAG: NUDIX hydrolase [Nocardioides sp.]
MITYCHVILVDSRGWLLMQERDSHAWIDPDRWGFCGGSIEEGETPEQAIYRELSEETGITLTEGLDPIGEFQVTHRGTHGQSEFALFAGSTTLTDADIVCGEGRQIVFVHPVVAKCLELSDAAAACLESYLASEHYAALADE